MSDPIQGLRQLLGDGLVTRVASNEVMCFCGRTISSFGWLSHFEAHARRGQVFKEKIQLSDGRAACLWRSESSTHPRIDGDNQDEV